MIEQLKNSESDYFSLAKKQSLLNEKRQAKGSAFSPLSIYEGSDIYRFDDVNKYPLNALCQLYEPNRMLIGSGVALSRNIVLTAGHNLKHPRIDGYIPHEILQGIHGEDRRKLSPKSIEDFIIHEKWEEDFNGFFDIALVKISSDMQHYVKITPWAELERQPVELYACGYPQRDFSHQHYGHGEFNDLNESLMAHTVDTEKGMSGGIILQQTQGGAYICGIHVGGFYDSDGGFNGRVNKAIIFNDQLTQWIERQFKILSK